MTLASFTHLSAPPTRARAAWPALLQAKIENL
jgi:hypothetical protein